MKSNPAFSAVLFDLDGTLLDTLDDIADSVNASLAAMDHPTHEVGAYKLMIGEGVRHLASCALPASACDDESAIDELLIRIRDEYARRWNVKTRPYDGIPELLDELAGLGMRVAILSNKPHEFTMLNVKELLPRWSFDAVIGQMDGVPVKPDPSQAIEIAKQLGIEASRFLYLGDSGVDMKTALAAGMFPVGALWGFREREELLENGAKALVAAPMELVTILTKESTLCFADCNANEPRQGR
jgi:phosphoglycolate phosphatase